MKNKLRLQQVLLVKLFFILSVIAVAIIFGTTYWYMGHQPKAAPAAPIPAHETEVPASGEGLAQIPVPASRVVSLCGITLTLPDLSFSRLERGDYFEGSNGCVYRSNLANQFTIMVTDRTKATSTDPNIFGAFDRYLNTQNVKEIITIAKTDSAFTKFALRTFQGSSAKNSVSYTGEVGPALPGTGVYQTATYLDNRYIIYLTYQLFAAQGDPWSLYFNKNSNGTNANNLFKSYMKQYVARPEIQALIDEMNASTKTIAVK